MIVKQFKGESGRTRLSLVDDGDKISVVFWMPPEMTVDIFEASDIIDMGQTLSSVEQGEAHDAVDELQGRLRELGSEILRVAEACPREHLDLSETKQGGQNE
tara:strand:+ start:40 stop:345 length:306 start_codon:yes stop_codon:yes gene_type:complete